jgi:PAS domain S-box-containing protein
MADNCKFMREKAYVKYGVAVTVTAIAVEISLLVEIWLRPTLGVFFYAAIAFAAWYGNLKTGLVATILSVAAINFFFIDPIGSFAVANIGDLLRLLAFTFVAGIISLLNNDLKRETTKVKELSRKLLEAAENRITIQEERWQLAVKGNKDGIWDHDLQTDRNYLSPRCLEILGYDRRQISTFKHWLDLVHPEDRPKLSQTFQAHLDGKIEYYSCEYRVFCAEGRYKWLLSRGKAMFDRSGKPKRAVGSITDIDERKQLEEKLRQQEELLRVIADNIPEGTIYQIRRDRLGIDRLTYISSGVRRYSIEPEAAIADISLLARQHFEEDQAQMLRIMDESCQKLIPARYQVRRRLPSGETRWSLFNAMPRRLENGETVWDGVEVDITDGKTTEFALRESERRYASLADTSPMGIFRSDIQGAITYINDRCCQIVGLSREEIMGHGWHISIHPADLDRVLQGRQNSIENRETCNLEYRFLHRDGKVVWVNAIAVTEMEDGDRLVGYIGTLNDITARKQAEIALQNLNQDLESKVDERTLELLKLNQKLLLEVEIRKQVEAEVRRREAEFKALVEHSPDPIARIDRQSRLIYLNPSATELLGISLDELSQKSIRDLSLSHANVESAELLIKEVFDRGEVRTIENFVRDLQGKDKFYQTFLVPEFDDWGKVESILSIARDLTELKKVERIKDEFLSIVSHELRTPLTAIRGSLGLLATGVYDDKPEKAKRMLEIASFDCERLVRLVNDILNLERLRSEQVDLTKESCSISDSIERAVENLQSIADRAQIQIKVSSIDASVCVSTDAILQVLTNLLGNAIKFSPSPSTIDAIVELQGDFALFQIRDRGRGIPRDKLESIFQRFQQVDISDSRNKGGTGLGLAICKSIVEGHGGKIWVESSLGEGSCFYFTLPLDTSKARKTGVTPSDKHIFLTDNC